MMRAKHLLQLFYCGVVYTFYSIAYYFMLLTNVTEQ